MLERLAAVELRSPEFLLREALADYLNLQTVRDMLRNAPTADADDADDPWDRYDGPTYTEEELNAEAKAASEHYRRTGLHLTLAEVEAWVDRLRMDPDAKLPECHT